MKSTSPDVESNLTTNAININL